MSVSESCWDDGPSLSDRAPDILGFEFDSSAPK